MRRKDLSGAQLWIGAMLATSSFIVTRLSGRKMSVDCRLVKSSVFDGGVGCCSGGRLERSRVNDVFERLLEARDGGLGLMFVIGESILLLCGVLLWEVRRCLLGGVVVEDDRQSVDVVVW